MTPQEVYNKVLLPYQREGVQKLATRRGSLLYDDPGLGKTLQTLTAIEINSQIEGVTIIVAPKFALCVWQAEIEKWYGKRAVIYTGTAKQRSKIWEEFEKDPAEYIITNYPMLKEVGFYCGIRHKQMVAPPHTTGTQPSVRKIKAIVLDEAHMSGIFNYKTQFFKVADVVFKYATLAYILTGTGIRQGCVDLYGPLHLIDPDKFPSYWSFVNKWCVKIPGPFGTTIERNPASLIKFRDMLSNYMVRRRKVEVLKQLVDKRRQKIVVPLSKEQKRIYDELEHEMLALIPDEGKIVMTPTVMSKLLRQRQVLASPALLGSKQIGAGIEAMVASGSIYLDCAKPIVVFTSFRKLIPIIEKAFKKEYPNVPFYVIAGGMTAQEFDSAVQSFQTGTGAAILCVVIKSGASFTATRADVAYFIGPDWDPNLNIQAEDRLHRIGQKNAVNVYYISSETPVEERVWSILNQKTETGQLVVGSEEEYLEALRRRQRTNAKNKF